MILTAVISFPVAAYHITLHDQSVDYLCYDSIPIDYAEVERRVSAASRRSFLRRVIGFLSTPLINNRKEPANKYSLRLIPAYRTEVGWYLRAQFGATSFVESTQLRVTSLAIAELSVRGYYHLAIVGNCQFLDNNVSYHLQTRTFCVDSPVECYGPTAQVADGVYDRVEHLASIVWHKPLHQRLYIGVAASYEDVTAKFDLEHQRASIVVARLDFGYDTREGENSSQRGVHLRAEQSVVMAVSEQLPPLYRFKFFARNYIPLWRGALLANDLQCEFVSKQMPWMFYPATDGKTVFRGYPLGRYIGRCMVAIQSELRQTVYGPISINIWLGAGTFFSRWRSVQFDEILPSYGIGLRIRFDAMTVFRFDYGFGRQSSDIIVGINEAF